MGYPHFRTLGAVKNFTTSYLNIVGSYDALLIDRMHQTDSRSMIGHSFDAHRNEVLNMGLILKLKIRFNKMDQPNGPALPSRYKYAAWPQQEWIKFKKDFRNQAHNWSSNFWLVLKENAFQNGNYLQAEKALSVFDETANMQTIIYPRVINCWIDPVIVDAGPAHAVMNMRYIVNANGSVVKAWSGPSPLRSDSANMHNLDIMEQIVVQHEVGHLLGLPHIGEMRKNPGCITPLASQPNQDAGLGYDRNEDPCYQDEMGSLGDTMGAGYAFGIEDAYPWKMALAEITGVPTSCYKVELSKTNSNIYTPRVLDHGTDEWNIFHNSNYHFRNDPIPA